MVCRRGVGGVCRWWRAAKLDSNNRANFLLRCCEPLAERAPGAHGELPRLRRAILAVRPHPCLSCTRKGGAAAPVRDQKGRSCCRGHCALCVRPAPPAHSPVGAPGLQRLPFLFPLTLCPLAPAGFPAWYPFRRNCAGISIDCALQITASLACWCVGGELQGWIYELPLA